MEQYPHSDQSHADGYVQQFFAVSDDIWMEYDRHQRVIAINPAGTALIQLPMVAMMGKTADELSNYAALSVSVQDILSNISQCVQQVCQTRELCKIVHCFASPDGTRFYETTYTPILHEGGVERVFAVGREVTDHRLVVLAALHPDNQELALSHSSGGQASVIVGAEMPGMQSSTRARIEEGERRAEREFQHASKAMHAPVSLDRQGVDQEQARSILQNAEFLRLVLDNIPQYIFWKDHQSVYLGCNHRWADMAGIGTPENVVGLTDADLPWTDEQKAWYLECDRRVMDTDTPMLRIKQSQLQADGRLTWRETSKLPIHDAEGNVVGLLGTIEDITERKVAEDLLRESEAKFRKLAQREELLNRLTHEIRRSLDLESILNTVVHEVRMLLDTDRVIVYKFEPDWHGEVVVEDVIPPWMSTLGSVSRDDCFPAHHAELYLQGRTKAIDNVVESELNDCHREFLQKMQVQANLIVPISTKSHLWGLLIAHHCEAPRHWKESEVSLLKQLGDQVAIAIQQAELYTQATESALHAQTQTEKVKRTLQELKQAQTQLIQTEKMSGLGQLVAGIAHEINNPVNFIYGNLSYITNYTQDLLGLIGLYQKHYPEPHPEISQEAEAIDLEFLLEDLAKILDSLKVGSERIRQIVLSLRNFSRLDEADVKPVDVHEGIDSTLLILQHRLKHKADGRGIHLVKDYGPLPMLECYPGQLNQVFMNLLSNAIDALEQWDEQRSPEEIPTKPAQITISTRLDSDERSDRALIIIHNNGPTIPESVQLRLFEPFFTTKPVGKGTGLGLSISHQIVVEKHRGSLTCRSHPETGTEFRIELPIRQHW
jgi:PAS domain S-box-containing protein